MGEVRMLALEQIAAGVRFDPDAVLEAAKGGDFSMLVIIGEQADGSVFLSSNANAGEALILLERAKHSIVFGDD